MARNRRKEGEGVILKHSAQGFRKIDPKSISTGQWVRMKCQFGCGGYGSCLTCPPHAPSPDESRSMLDSYSTAYLIYWGEEFPGREALAEIERQTFLMGFYKAFAMACGPCDLCDECNLDGECRHPRQARPSMEACGIDVFQTARNAGFPIEVVTDRGETCNFYSLLLVE